METIQNEEQWKAMARQLRKPDNEEGVKVGLFMNKGNYHINVETIQALDLQPHDNILEIGMGNGFFVKDILSVHPSITYTGCDFSETMVEEAQKINAEFISQKRAGFHLASAENLPFPNAAFHKVFTINTLYFWENPIQTLAEFKRVMAPEGMLIIAVRPKRVMDKIPATNYGFTKYTKEDLVELLQSNGFSIVNIIEKKEPAQEHKERSFDMENLIVVAKIEL